MCKKSRLVQLDEILSFTNGEQVKHIQLIPHLKDVKVFEDFHRYHDICEALMALFEKNNAAINKLKHHAKLVSQVLTKKGENLQFSESFLYSNPKSELYDFLIYAFGNKDTSKLSVKAPTNLPDFWSGPYENDVPLQQFENDSVMKSFFDNFTISYPAVEELTDAIQRDWIVWMKSRIHPDVYRRLSEDQLREPFDTFKEYFEKWVDLGFKRGGRKFLTLDDGRMCLKTVQDKLNSYVKQYRPGYVEEHYINRRVLFLEQHKLGGKIKDEQFIKWLGEDWNDDHCISLIAQPGTGKTTLWQYLAFQTQLRYTDVEVYLIYLDDLKVGPDIDRKCEVDNVLGILKEVISEQNIKCLLDQKKRKIVIFLDAFDEVKEDYKQSILNFMKAFDESRSIVKILINSRECCRQELKAHLQCDMIDIVPLDDDGRQRLLRSFWNVEPSDKFSAYSNELLFKFASEDTASIGLPLTIKILSDVFTDTFQQYMEAANLESVLKDVPRNIIFLYNQFIRKSIMIWLCGNNEESSKIQLESTVETTEFHYQLLAMDRMNLTNMLKGDHKTQLKQFQNKLEEKQDKFPLLEIVNGDHRFSHQTVAEFLCAKYIFERIGTDKSSNRVRWKVWSGFVKRKKIQNLIFTFERNCMIRKFFLRMIDVKLNLEQEQNLAMRHQEILESIGEMVEVWACEDNCGELLSKAVNVDKLRNIRGIRSTLLHIAAKSNSHRALQVLLKATVNTDVEDELEKTPLYYACSENHLNVVELLVEKSAQMNHRPNERCPLCIAAFNGHLETVDYLLSNKAFVLNQVECTALQYAAGRGHLDIVQSLIKSGVNINLVDDEQRNALHYAAVSGCTAVVQELLKEGANVNVRDNEGNTPVHYADLRGHVNIVELLNSHVKNDNSN